MLLYVMRHGPAEDRSPTGRDFDRRLTPDGREVVRAAAVALRDHLGGAGAGRSVAPVPRVLSSPRVRALETATIVCETVGTLRGEAEAQGTVEVEGELDGEQPIPSELVSTLVASGVDTLLVGHQPAVEELCRRLIQPDPLPLHSFPTATIVALAPEGGRVRVAAVLDPRGARR